MMKMNFAFLFVLMISLTITPQSRVEQSKRDAQILMNYFNSIRPAKTVTDPVVLNIMKNEQPLGKVTADFVTGQKYFIMNGNNITVDLYNYGGIAGGLPNANIREVSNLVWRKLPYIFQFCPIVGASVPSSKDSTRRLHIITDGLYDYDNYRDESPTGERWVWKPLPGYADPDQPYMASNPTLDSDHDGKPDSWPRDWYNTTLGKYVWPGYLTQGVNNADLECYWAMDDRANTEFPYYPYKNDTTKMGLGVQVDCRAFQWSNSLAANTIFVVYSITNKSDKDLDSVVFGIYGDPDIGGKDNKDDNGYFVPPYGPGVGTIPVYARSMVYFWDPDMKGDRGLPLGYLGCKFLESPGNPNDGIDNDGDGIIDERQDDGIDNDNDWNPEKDDVGIDGIPGTGDPGEGDGLPTAGLRLNDGTPDPLHPGEPNFEYTDLDESDQIGLTSFNSWIWSQAKISNDEDIWQRCVPGNFGNIEQNNDLVFVFGSGYISLKKGETKRISMAFLFGQDLPDLLNTAATVQDIYNKNYRFFKPPDLPNVTAVPDDKKVTLFWDTKAEESVDPITGRDFEGYVIYRSTDPSFSDILTVTDGRGADFMYEPLKDTRGFEAKWDIVNEWKGYHPVPYQGKGLHYYLGDNTGLVHSFVDSNNVINGQTYYYAVVAYDHGDSLGIPPSETSKNISFDPITSQIRLASNTVKVIPGPRAAGYLAPEMKANYLQHISGIGNGSVSVRVLDDFSVKNANYRLTFSDSMYVNNVRVKAKNFSVASDQIVTEDFYLYDNKFTSLQHTNIITDTLFVVKNAAGTVYRMNTDYVMNNAKGQIRRADNSTMPNNSKYTVTYKYFPVYQSTVMSGEDANPEFDGIRISVTNYTSLIPDESKSKWIAGGKTIPWTAKKASIDALNKMLWPADYRITFSNTNIDSCYTLTPEFMLKKIPINYKVEDVTTGIAVPVLTFLDESKSAVSNYKLNRGEEIVFFKPGASFHGDGTDTLTWGLSFPKALNDTILPGAGDVFQLIVQRPFEKNDVFTLKTVAGSVSNDAAKSRLDNVYVVPNPYIAVSDIEPANRLASQNRGERRIYFENLPMKCTIRIYTLTGELVKTLEHDQGVDNGREFWNLLNRDGFSVSYGVYLAHIDAPGIGEKLIKFALIK